MRFLQEFLSHAEGRDSSEIQLPSLFRNLRIASRVEGENSQGVESSMSATDFQAKYTRRRSKPNVRIIFEGRDFNEVSSMIKEFAGAISK